MEKLKTIKLYGGKWSFFPFHMIYKHHPGNESIVADTLSQTCAATLYAFGLLLCVVIAVKFS